ncbi:MAG: DUF4062 domain-containing protein [Pseudomonadota bacterium]
MDTPKQFQAIMVASTFADLKEDRRAVIDAINRHGFRAEVMEYSGAQAESNVIDASLKMVRNAAALVTVIGHRYGQIPLCPDSNPDELSITELEFNEAIRLDRPILLFIMGDDYAVKPAHVERDPERLKKLHAFRERAKKMGAGSEVERIYQVFNTKEEFLVAATTAVAKVASFLDRQAAASPNTGQLPTQSVDGLHAAAAPDLRALPRYLGSHRFVGRQAELNMLDDWCAAADPNPMLLFEAIGGSGKSMLTWTWLNAHAPVVRDDWAGRLWFSFYEGGATMRSFCQEALAYITSTPVEEFRKLTTRAMMPDLLAQLEARPWLLVLDGLERILVAYHRVDAPHMRDGEVEQATDQILDRDPRAAINPEDDELLRRLAGPSQSKVLVSSRLTPQALVNNANARVPGVRHEPLYGLRPSDAEAMFRACEVTGDGASIRRYLQRNCDCHPLVIGALAGLVNEYLPDRGNFDAWLEDPAAGGKLGLADLDLKQRQHHILDAAINSLPPPDRRLLQTLSLLNGSASYDTLRAFNPHMPPAPAKPQEFRPFRYEDSEERLLARQKHQQAQTEYEQQLSTWQDSPEYAAAIADFDETLRQLERRGLLQYERGLKSFDLHPVVRGVASGRLNDSEAREIGEGVVDYFSGKPLDTWEQAKSLHDLAPGIQLVVTLTRMGEFERASRAYLGDLVSALNHSLQAKSEQQRVLKPFFPDGWHGRVMSNSPRNQAMLLGAAGVAFSRQSSRLALDLRQRALRIWIDEESTGHVCSALREVGGCLEEMGDLGVAAKCYQEALTLAETARYEDSVFSTLLFIYNTAQRRGDTTKADEHYARLSTSLKGRNQSALQRSRLETIRAHDMYHRGHPEDALTTKASLLCKEASNRLYLHFCLMLQGEILLDRDEVVPALAPLTEAVRLLRESGEDAPRAESLLALAKLRAGQESEARDVAERYDDLELSSFEQNGGLTLVIATIWQELGEGELAVKAALRAHHFACGRGEPYVVRFRLNRAIRLLEDLGQTLPPIPQYDPSEDLRFDWEGDLRALNEKARKGRE